MHKHAYHRLELPSVFSEYFDLKIDIPQSVHLLQSKRPFYITTWWLQLRAWWLH